MTKQTQDMGLKKLFLLVALLLQVMPGCSSRDEQRGKSKTLAESAIGSWLQKNKIASRLCVRKVSTDRYQTGIQNGSASKSVGRCSISYRSRKDQDVTADESELCPGKSQCVATESAVSTIRTVDSIRQVTSAVSCMCMPRERRCRLRSHLQVFHKGTRFEKSINVGECVGRCKGLRGCRCNPLTTKTVTVKGPNGHHCVETVQKCGCVKSCYRVTHKEAFVVLARDHKHNRTTTTTKVIDVGRCVGSCSGNVNGKCMYWIQVEGFGKGSRRRKRSTAKHCLFGANSRPVQCAPKQTRTVTLETPGGTGTTNVGIIDSCACS